MKEYDKILFPYAYNILGSSEEAKDAVQEVVANYVSSGRQGIENVKGYLIKSVINQSINIRHRRKKLSYQNVWLPEPVDTHSADTNTNLKDIISYAMLILLEQLNPKERAVFILKEAFGYTHEEIAEVLSSTTEHSRKLLSRAKLKLNQSKQAGTLTDNRAMAVFQTNPYTHKELFQKYIQAIRNRDINGLENLLTEAIVITTDGGDHVNVVRERTQGRKATSRLLVYAYHKFQQRSTVVFSQLNHQPAVMFFKGKRLLGCQVFEMEGEKISRINSVVTPQKLKHIKKGEIHVTF